MTQRNALEQLDTCVHRSNGLNFVQRDDAANAFGHAASPTCSSPRSSVSAAKHRDKHHHSSPADTQQPCADVAPPSSPSGGKDSLPHAQHSASKELAVPSQPLKFQMRMVDRSTAAVCLEAHYQLPPHLLFDMLADPHQHATIFESIESADAELLHDAGGVRQWRLDYKARWKFWRVSGVCQNKMYLWTDRTAGTVIFKLREPGFLKKYEGTWTIRPAGGTVLFDSSSSSSSSNIDGSSSSSIDGSFSVYQAAAGAPAAAAAAAGSAGSVRFVPPPVAGVSAAGAAGAGALNPSLLSPLSSRPSNPMHSQLIGELAGALSALGVTQAGLAGSTPGGSSHASLGQYNASNSSSSLKDVAAGTGSREARDQKQQQQQQQQQTVITVESLTSPKMAPPPLLSSILKHQAKRQLNEMLEGLVQAAAAAAAAAAAKTKQLQTVPLHV